MDYYVGTPTNITLLDPTVPGNLPSGVWVNSASHLIVVGANNVTLDGYDFSLHGGYAVYDNGFSGLTVSNSYFYNPAAGVAVLTQGDPSNTTIVHNTIDGGGAAATNTSFGETLALGGNNTVVEYNWIRNTVQHFVSVNGGGSLTYEYNLLEDGGWAQGAHVNLLQMGGGNFTSIVADYNTWVQHVTPAQGEGFQLYLNNAGSIASGDISENTMITVPNGTGTVEISAMINAGSNSSGPVTGTVNNNYMDLSDAYGPFGGSKIGITYSHNINLQTGALL